MNNSDFRLPKQTLNVPKDNDAYVIWDFVDENGNLLDLTGTQEITFAVWDSEGGTLQFQYTLTGGQIVIHGNDYQFSHWVNASDTAILPMSRGYHEVQVVNNVGRKRTVSSGLFRSVYTYIKDIV